MLLASEVKPRHCPVPKFLDFVAFDRRASGGVLALALVWCLAGCSKNNNIPPSSQVTSNPPATVATTNLPAITPPAAVTMPAPVAANGEVDLPELNRDLRRWIVSHRQAPKSFEEFAATAGVNIPPPPPGKKYVLTKDMHIQLVNQ
jgi:hypothetical protein